MQYLWQWFCELSDARGSSGFGAAALGFADLDAWARFSGITLSRFERDTLLQLDRAYMDEQARQAREKK